MTESDMARSGRITMGVIIGLLLLAVLVIAISAWMLFARAYLSLERDRMITDLKRIDAGLDNELADIRRVHGDWAAWDQTVRFMQGRYPDYIKDNLDVATMVSQRLSLVMYVANHRTLKYSSAVDLLNRQAMSLQPRTIARLLAMDALYQHANTQASHDGVLLLPEGPLLVSSHPIVPNDYSGPIAGTLVVGRFLDAQELSRLSSLLQLSIHCTLYRETPLGGLTFAPLDDDNDVAVRPLDRNTVAGYLLQRDFFGKPALVLEVRNLRDVYHQGMLTVGAFLGILAWVIVMLGTILVRLLQQSEQSSIEYQQRLRALSASLAQVEEHERRRIAGDLHDHIGQTLVAARLVLGALKESLTSTTEIESVDDVRTQLERAIEWTRSLTIDLHPPILYRSSFRDAAQWLAERMMTRAPIQIVLADDWDDRPLSPTCRTLLFQTLRELLINIVKHANAHEVELSLRAEGGWLRLTVVDDGSGFTPATVDQKGGFGLFSIQERIQYYGGEVDIDSHLGGGTRVQVRLPLSDCATEPAQKESE